MGQQGPCVPDVDVTRYVILQTTKPRVYLFQFLRMVHDERSQHCISDVDVIRHVIP